MYKTLSCYDAERDGIKFKLEDLDFIINKIGCDLETLRESTHADSDETLNKDDEHPLVSSYHLKYITNGEYYWGVYQCLLYMTNDLPDQLHPSQKVMLCKPVEIAISIFLDQLEFAEDGDTDKEDILRIHNRIQQCNGQGYWTNESGDDITSKQLKEFLSKDHWLQLTDSILDEMFPERGDYRYLDHFSKHDWEPHFPTIQEYRKALVWFESAYAKTRANNQSK